MKYKSILDSQWLYQPIGSKYYDCGMRAILNSYMFWNGYDSNIRKKLTYYRKKYGPYVGNNIGEMETSEMHHMAHSLDLSMLPIAPTERGMNGVLHYHLPILCSSTKIKNGAYVSGDHGFCIFPNWKGINVCNKPVHKIEFDDLILPGYEFGKPWNVMYAVIPKNYSLKIMRHKVTVDSISLFRIISENIYSDFKYK